MPTASIIIPCYNAESFVKETLTSACLQTVEDIEIICVNDGSTDGTLALLERMAAQDKRIRVISQPNGGEGPARDAGLAAARGDWLYFLDSDDIMEHTLLEEAIAACKDAQADLVVFRTMLLDMQTGEERLCDWSFRRDWVQDDVFCPRDYPAHIFNSFQNWVHNKLFRASFVRDHDLHMQHVHRSADLLFTCRALAEADRIALLNRPLHHYRVNNPQSAMMTSDSYPLDFYQGFRALRASLEEHGTWELYHDSFVNWAIEGIAVNLRHARSFEGYCAIANTMRDEGLERLDVLGFPRHKSDSPVCYDQVSALVDASPEEALFSLMAFYRAEKSNAQTAASFTRLHNQRLEYIQIELDGVIRKSAKDLSDRHQDIQDLQKAIQDRDKVIQNRDKTIEDVRTDFHNVVNSTSFKIGRLATSLPRHARDLTSFMRYHKAIHHPTSL